MRRRRVVAVAVLGTFALAAIGAVVPGPPEGVWWNPLINCFCDQVHRIEFRDGEAWRWSSHDNVWTAAGTYARHPDGWIWRPSADHPEDIVPMRFTWLTIRMDDPGLDFSCLGWRTFGWDSPPRAR